MLRFKAVLACVLAVIFLKSSTFREEKVVCPPEEGTHNKVHLALA